MGADGDGAAAADACDDFVVGPPDEEGGEGAEAKSSLPSPAGNAGDQRVTNRGRGFTIVTLVTQNDENAAEKDDAER